MTKTKTKAVTVMAALLLPAASAHAQTVTFTDINDAVPGKFFDAASSVPDASDPNTLVIGLNTGLDGTIWKHRDFKASLLPFSYPSATDTISFVIHAPDGYYVATVTYQENLVLGNSRFGAPSPRHNWSSTALPRRSISRICRTSEPHASRCRLQPVWSPPTRTRRWSMGASWCRCCRCRSHRRCWTCRQSRRCWHVNRVRSEQDPGASRPFLITSGAAT